MTKQTELNRAATDIHRDLVGLCKKGDRVAQYRLYKLYSQAMYNICLRMVSDQDEAHDLLQESFIKAFSKLRSFRGDCTFGVWLKRIVINQCISYLRKRPPFLIGMDENQVADIPDEPVEDSEISPELIHESIRDLPARARVIFNLFCLEGYRHKEIAEMLGITESTSKTQYHRARLMIQQKIKEKLYEKQTGILY
ncbi:MAG: sigma-70 family RNA polymerase sigma factor [Bacteroidales bacterium]|nr:sigma-70 family RNA polymerase sigma factor [Bacteroidales bacterium]